MINRIIFNVKNNIKRALIRSYFKVYNDSYVNSSLVSFSACLGKKVWIDEGVRIFPDVEVGDYTCVNGDALLESGSIGKFCSIAANVAIGAGEHPLHFLSTNVATYENITFGLIDKKKRIEQKKRPPIIGNDVWIARDAIILRGVNIGNGAVIAANAVVTKDVPPYAIVAGSPAKIINFRFDEKTIDILQKSKWWENEKFYKNNLRNDKYNIYELLEELDI